MKNLMSCSIEELLAEKQKSVKSQDVVRYRECNELIDNWVTMIVKKLNIEVMFNDLAEEEPVEEPVEEQ